MDEPFAALDEITRQKLNDDLLSLKGRDGATVIFVTHSVSNPFFCRTASSSCPAARPRGARDRVDEPLSPRPRFRTSPATATSRARRPSLDGRHRRRFPCRSTHAHLGRCASRPRAALPRSPRPACPATWKKSATPAPAATSRWAAGSCRCWSLALRSSLGPAGRLERDPPLHPPDLDWSCSTLVEDWAMLWASLLSHACRSRSWRCSCRDRGVGLRCSSPKAALRRCLLSLRGDPSGHAHRLGRAARSSSMSKARSWRSALRLDRRPSSRSSPTRRWG
jgi:hypothetical protein